jgi:uncharacterized tellurite resistance protein B-like protein
MTPTEEAIMSFRFTADEMNKLTDAQKDTIIDVVIAAVLADGNVQASEQAMFKSELGKVPWGRSEEEMIDTINASFAKVSSFTKPEQAVALVNDAAATLTDQAIRDKTFAMMARMMYADKQITENESVVLFVFAKQFGISDERAKEIGSAVKRGD